MFTPAATRFSGRGVFFGVILIGGLLSPAGASSAVAPSTATDNTDPDREDVTKMAAYNVKADRVEEFGFRVNLRGPPWEVAAFVTSVYPNTAAAKAGLKPGDRVLTTDGRRAGASIFSLGKWRDLHAKKWAEVASGKPIVTWTLEVQSPGQKERRVVKMTVPTPPPHWGAKEWKRPEDRVPAVVPEPGPLATLARDVLDHGIWAVQGWRRQPWTKSPSKVIEVPMLGFQWTLKTDDGVTHRIMVTQQRGPTEIVFTRSTQERSQHFTTSPTGALENASQPLRGNGYEPTEPEALRAAFQQELDFWLKGVGRVTGRWPFEVLSAAGPVVAVMRAAPVMPEPGRRAASFLQLPAATARQRALFSDALGNSGPTRIAGRIRRRRGASRTSA